MVYEGPSGYSDLVQLEGYTLGVLSRDWRSGDIVRIAMPFTLRTESTPDQPNLQALMYGPIHLVALEPRKPKVGDLSLNRAGDPAQ